MTAHQQGPPSRMRDYRIRAELRRSPDLHLLAQLFINMALERTNQESRKPTGLDESSRPPSRAEE